MSGLTARQALYFAHNHPKPGCCLDEAEPDPGMDDRPVRPDER